MAYGLKAPSCDPLIVIHWTVTHSSLKHNENMHIPYENPAIRDSQKSLLYPLLQWDLHLW